MAKMCQDCLKIISPKAKRCTECDRKHRDQFGTGKGVGIRLNAQEINYKCKDCGKPISRGGLRCKGCAKRFNGPKRRMVVGNNGIANMPTEVLWTDPVCPARQRLPEDDPETPLGHLWLLGEGLIGGQCRLCSEPYTAERVKAGVNQEITSPDGGLTFIGQTKEILGGMYAEPNWWG